eukprot:362837-Chlamydomonas_euryale.AAC.4
MCKGKAHPRCLDAEEEEGEAGGGIQDRERCAHRQCGIHTCCPPSSAVGLYTGPGLQVLIIFLA